MKGIPKKCTRPPRIPSVVIRERAVTPAARLHRKWFSLTNEVMRTRLRWMGVWAGCIRALGMLGIYSVIHHPLAHPLIQDLHRTPILM